MYLHEDKELFKEVIINASVLKNKPIAIIEKDYYVTMILQLLSIKANNIVFKGGTSLSKGFNVISRFSEDIDITFTEHLGEARRKKLKYNIMKSISEELKMPISNWETIESDKDYNCYIFKYDPIDNYLENGLAEGVKVEISLSSYAFPTVVMELDNYVRQYLILDNSDLIEKYKLNTFSMKLQSLERTFIDKIFALCDYYLQGKSKRYSRHLYDIYKLKDKIVFNNDFKKLIKEVRNHRAKMVICPSAKDGINISQIVHEFCNNDFFKNDYQIITNYFLDDFVTYDDTISLIIKIIDEGYFDF